MTAVTCVSRDVEASGWGCPSRKCHPLVICRCFQQSPKIALQHFDCRQKRFPSGATTPISLPKRPDRNCRPSSKRRIPTLDFAISQPGDKEPTPTPDAQSAASGHAMFALVRSIGLLLIAAPVILEWPSDRFGSHSFHEQLWPSKTSHSDNNSPPTNAPQPGRVSAIPNGPSGWELTPAGEKADQGEAQAGYVRGYRTSRRWDAALVASPFFSKYAARARCDRWCPGSRSRARPSQYNPSWSFPIWISVSPSSE